MLRIYNTMSRKKEIFKPIDENIVKIYTCGPTVYSASHIGNMRAYIFMDNLKKALKYNGYKTKLVMNITDVGHMTSDSDEGEDKMEKAAKKTGINPYEIAKKYTELFMSDITKLNIEKPEVVAKATEHITEMEEYVNKIVENGYGYETSKGIYFDTKKLKSYGELSKMNLEKNIAGARIEVDPEKKNSLDFAIWIKSPKDHIMKWNSKWGMCYPGWHMECSAMSQKYLGEVFDIHTGGVDHVQIHHENEIAQSRGATGKNPANYWMHVEFLQVNSGKMGKSLGNAYTVEYLEKKGFEPLAYRYFTYTSHYRNKLNFTFEGINAAQITLNRLREQYTAHKNGNAEIDKKQLETWKFEFLKSINDDLNFPLALSVVWEAAKYNKKSKEIAKLLKEFDYILSLDIDKEISSEVLNVNQNIKVLLEERKIAREKKDFGRSDELRDKIKELGYIVSDSKTGQKLEKN